MKNEKNMTSIINFILRGEINWRNVKEMFIKQEKPEMDDDYITIVVAEEPERNILANIGIHGLNIQRNDIIKIDKDTYLKLRNINIVREVNINR